jgi:hypothetical protein
MKFFNFNVILIFSIFLFISSYGISQVNGVYKSESGFKLIIKDFNKDIGFNVQLSGEKCICDDINGFCEPFYPENPNEDVYYLYYKKNEGRDSEPSEPYIKLTPKNGLFYIDYLDDSIMCPSCWGLDKTFKKIISKTQNPPKKNTKKTQKK